MLMTVLFRIYEAFCLLFRAVRLGLTFIPIGLLYPITCLGSYPESLWWKLFLTGIENSGPIFIKFGQWISTRRDLFPETCCNQFSRLLRRSKPHSWHYTKEQLFKAFGKNWRKYFVKFDNNSNPIGSGCVAQVYKVWMNEDEIKNQDILDEILQEQEEVEDKNDYMDDGVEVSSLRRWFWSTKKEKAEEEMAILEFRKARDLKREKERLENLANSSPSNIMEVTEGLADELVSQQEDQPTQVDSKETANAEAGSDKTHESSNGEVSHEEHALVEQWQVAPDSLEKSLPVTGHLDSMEGLVPVALKVLHPGVYRTFQRDTSILRGCAGLVTSLFPSLRWLALQDCVDEFFGVMSSQIDLRKEAANLDTFIEAFSAVDTVRFPRPVRPFVTRRVMAETFEEGEPMLSFITDDKPEPIKKNLAKIGVDALLKMIFQDNFIHGDLHPGNLLVQNDTTSPSDQGSSPAHDGNAPKLMLVDIGGDTFVMNVVGDPRPLRICVLDCGIVSRLRERDLLNFRAVFQEVVVGRGQAVADLFLENSEHQCTDPDAFREAMRELVRAARRNAVSLEQVDVGLLLQDVLGLLHKHQIRLESAFSSVVMAVFVLEGLGRSLDPEMDILERARPLLAS